ncbi:glycosyltransferase family 2 protein [Histidinibacterium aquaticum]|uniref:Glycosyltransferase family 2 protein n=1 Tax=Histidinibacterium aquaticum TaxID=2613962 RepID=A0A5J5GM99_9RHOB|nr:glycosyltransferase family 2 protein [Histidinibacterium aquaticum]KAA9009325.1 glycosyltransferase family 2 protein [Histidinibacterium aquaticum]
MSPRHRYTILSMMKDEGHSLVEWVAYHRHIGFDNIVVYTNDCSDGTDAMLERLQEMGWVQHFRNEVPEGKKPQPNALTLAGDNPEVTDSEWILVMDADEFLSIKCGRGWITDLVERIPPEAQAMAITWRFFGSSGLTEWNPGLVIENYTKGAPDKFKKGWGVKTLFRPYRDMKFGIHRPSIRKAKQDPANAKFLFEQLWVNGSGEPMPDEFSLSGWRSTKPTLGYKLAEMNHYAVKSYESYLLRRLRGNVNNKEDKYNAAYFALFDRNELEATNALRHAKPVKKKMAKILSDPVMRKLQDEALAYHAARVERLRATGEYDRWLAELKDASETSIDELDEVLFIQHLPKKWQEKVKELQAQGVPDKTIARMIASTQTAKKGETRSALLETAGVKAREPAEKDRPEEREAASEAALTLDNPFEGTPEAKALGVPSLRPGAPKPPAAETPKTAEVSLDAPAPPLGRILDEVTVSSNRDPRDPLKRAGTEDAE